MSRDEQRLGSFILQHRHDDFCVDGMGHCMDLMCDTSGKEPVTKQYVCELLKYNGNTDVLETFQKWTMPKFPFSGHHLVTMGVPKGPKFSKMLNVLRKKWQDSRYTATEADLLSYANTIVGDYVKK